MTTHWSGDILAQEPHRAELIRATMDRWPNYDLPVGQWVLSVNGEPTVTGDHPNTARYFAGEASRIPGAAIALARFRVLS